LYLPSSSARATPYFSVEEKFSNKIMKTLVNIFKENNKLDDSVVFKDKIISSMNITSDTKLREMMDYIKRRNFFKLSKKEIIKITNTAHISDSPVMVKFLSKIFDAYDQVQALQYSDQNRDIERIKAFQEYLEQIIPEAIHAIINNKGNIDHNSEQQTQNSPKASLLI
jgi:hypothetical protein